MGVKWQVFLERGVFQRYKGRGLKNFHGVVPQNPTLLAAIAVQPPPPLKPLRGPW